MADIIVTEAALKSDSIGWVPIDFGWRAERPEHNFDRIAWMNCGGVSFSEPFFLQTIARLRSQAGDNRIIWTNLSAITNRREIFSDYQPSGIIFHISRCGSTAISNCLKLCDNTQVVSEYWPLTQFHWNSKFTQRKRQSGSTRAIDSLAITAAAWSLATCRRGVSENLILKLTSSSLHSIETIRKVWPNTPCILIIRHPLEVLASSLKGGGWLALKSDPLRGPHLAGLSFGCVDAVNGMTDEEYGARVIGNYLKIALKNHLSFDMIIRHDQLTSATVRAVASTFNLDSPEVRKTDLELSLDAKQANGSRYLRGSAIDRDLISAAMEIEIYRYALPEYNSLTDKLSERKSHKWNVLNPRAER